MIVLKKNLNNLKYVEKHKVAGKKARNLLNKGGQRINFCNHKNQSITQSNWSYLGGSIAPLTIQHNFGARLEQLII